MPDSLSTRDFADGPRADFFRRHLAWIALGVAGALALARMVPAVYLAYFSSDCIQMPVFYRDVLVNGNPAGGWIWGGHSDLFPEVALTFLAWTVTHANGMFILYFAAGVIMAGYVAVLVALYRQAGGRGATSYAAVAVLLFTVLLLFSDRNGALLFALMVVVPMHTGINVMALVCLALSLRVLRAGMREKGGAGFWTLGAACFLSAASNPLYIVTFFLPFIAALAVAWALYRGRLRDVLPLAGNILLCTAAGHFLEHRLFPARVDAAQFTHYDAGAALAAWRFVLKQCNPRIGGWYVAFVALDAAYLLFAAGMLARVCRRAVAKRMPPGLFLLLLFVACLICCNWAATILAGDYYELKCSRFVRLPLLMPLFILAGWLHHRLQGRVGGWNGKATAAMALASCCGSLFFLPQPCDAYLQYGRVMPVMREIMQREHITAGLSNYWPANAIGFLSDDTVRLRAVKTDGRIWHWINNLAWFTGDGNGKAGHGQPGGARPEFRLIYMEKLNPRLIRFQYGDPAQIIATVTGHDIWIYPPEKSITYNPYYEALSNDPPEIYRVGGNSLFTIVGKRTPGGIVTLPGGAPGFLSFGPYVNLHAGRYRVAIHYTYLAPPAPGQPTRYDAVRWHASMGAYDTIAQGELPFIDTAPHDAELELHIADEGHTPVEVRTIHPGNGSVRIEGVRFVRVGE